MIDNNQESADWITEIRRSDQPEIDKLKACFGHITTQIIEFADKEIELARAIQDREALVKHQIKMETIKRARSIFDLGYRIATGKRAWEERDER